MSEIESIPISAALGDRNADVKVEESWSKDVPSAIGANAPVEEFNRTKAIELALRRPSGRRSPEPQNLSQAQEMRKSILNGIEDHANLAIIKPFPMLKHHFFVVDGRKMVFIGSKEIDVTKFQKDLSGRFFREWLKKNFPGRRDYDDICVWNDATTLKEITDLLGMVE